MVAQIKSGLNRRTKVRAQFASEYILPSKESGRQSQRVDGPYIPPLYLYTTTHPRAYRVKIQMLFGAIPVVTWSSKEISYQITE